MANVIRETIGTLQDKITVKVTKEDYYPSFEKSLKTYAKTANVPGFRKGMVPAGMIRKMYGQSIFNDEIIRQASEKLNNYLQQEKVAIFAQPMIIPSETPVQLDMNAPGDVDFQFEIGVKPDFEIPALNGGTTLNRYAIDISDKLVDDEVLRITRRFGKVESQETINAKDDIIYSTYEACDEAGTVAEGAEKMEDTVLLDKLPAKLQEMLQSKSAGESLVFRPMDVCTPDELKAFLKDPLKKDDSAAEQYFKLTITKVGLLVPRALDETLFAEVFQNADIKDEGEFKARIREELQRDFARLSNDRLNNEIYEILVHQTPFDIPVTFLKRWLREGQEKPKSEAEVEKEFPGFEHQLRWTLISDKLISENGIKVDREEVLNDIKGRVLAYFGMTNEDDAPWMDSYMDKLTKDEKSMNETYQRLLFDKLFQYLHTRFKVEDKTVTEEEFFKLADPHATHHHHH